MNTYYDLDQAAEFDLTDIRATTHEDGEAEYQANLPSQEEMEYWDQLANESSESEFTGDYDPDLILF